MRWVSTDPSEFGVIGVGQHAHGFFAFGQVARGVIAIGQLAIGVVAIGQLSFSVVGVGQVGGGVAWFAGMLGLGGRGICFRLIPGLDLPRTPPPQVTLNDVWQGAKGYVRLAAVPTPAGAALGANGQLIPVKMRPQVAWALNNAVRQSDPMREVFAHLRREGEVMVCDKLMEIPGQRKGAIPLWLNIVRFIMLIGLATAWCFAFEELVLS